MVHLKDLESSLLSKASDKELMLYRFLKGQKHTVKVKDNDLQTSVCVKAFMEGQGENDLRNLRKIKPFKGLHYTNNLELLVAASLIEAGSEEENIEKYLLKRTSKECFIINSALTKNFRVLTSPNSEIEKLANKLMLNERIELQDIQCCINEVSDLYEYYILEKGITKFNLDFSFENKQQEYETFYSFGIKAIKRIETFFLVGFYLALFFVCIKIAPGIAQQIMSNWDTLEPLAYMMDKVVIFLLASTGFLLTNNIAKIKSVVRSIIRTLVFKLLGINVKQYEDIVERIKTR
ncbi:hypothetical protein [Planctobacterium marinum]|uniref:hypothetical protein n=1 Tax=Planctobacterium marinum TaxID=1631968 RepID=UPI001E354E58|nr:hypothetical protein [Planctobacterium marinum]MCC2606813.1 hypothetical protein [Planctobacterium marinum]